MALNDTKVLGSEVEEVVAAEEVSQETQAQAEVEVVENFDPKAKNFIRKGFGGTFMSPAYKMIVENKIRCDAVITITDGFIEHTLDDKIPKVPFIFLVTRDKENLALDVSANPRMKSHTLEIDKKK